MITLLSRLFKKPLVIYLDSYKRDLSHALSLSSKLNKRGIPTLISCRRNHSYIIKLLRPNHVYCIGQLNCVSPPLFKERIHLSPAEGWSDDTYGDFYFPSNPSLYHSLDTIFFWGSFGKTWFQSNRPQFKIPRLIVSGFPKAYSLSTNHVNCPDSSSPKFYRIGLVGRCSSLADMYGRSTAELLFMADSEHVIHRIRVEAKLLLFYKSLSELVSGSNIKLSYRPHPTERVELLKPYFNSVSTFESVGKWLSSVDAVIGPSSTLSLDAFISNKPYFSVDSVLDLSSDTLNAEHFMHIVDQQMTSLDTSSPSLSDLEDIIYSPSPGNLDLLPYVDLNLPSIDIISNSLCRLYFSYSILNPLSLLFFYLIDFLHVLFHSLARPYRLRFDYSKTYLRYLSFYHQIFHD